MDTRNWIRVSKMDTTPNMPIKASTAYKWHHLRKIPKAFKKLGGILFVDLDELYRVGDMGGRK